MVRPLLETIGDWSPWKFRTAEVCTDSQNRSMIQIFLSDPEVIEPCCEHEPMVHALSQVIIKDLPILGLPVQINLNRRQFQCVQCGRQFTESASWIHEDQQCTERYHQDQVANMPIAKAMVVLQEERRLFFGGPMVVFKWMPTPDWAVVYVSPNVSDVLGYSPLDFFSDRIPYLSVVHPDDLIRIREDLRAHIEAKSTEVLHKRYRMRNAHGEWRWVDDFTTVDYLPEGKASIMNGYVLDVTTQRQVEMDLREHQKRLDLVLEGTNTGLWILDLVSRRFYGNEKWLKRFGIQSDIIGHGHWHRWVHPNDLDYFRSQIAKCLEGVVEHLDVECRFGSETIGWTWMHLRAALSDFREDGTAGRLAGIVTDISKRKEMEALVINGKRRLESIFNAIQSCVMILDAKTHVILDVNPEACVLLGRTRSEIVGQVCFSFVCPSCEGKCPLSQTLSPMKNMERQVMHVSGKRIPVLKTVTTVELDGRECYIESFVDISLQKQAELKLRDNLQETERMNRLMVDREYRVLELKEEVNALCRLLKEPSRYNTAGTGD